MLLALAVLACNAERDAVSEAGTADASTGGSSHGVVIGEPLPPFEALTLSGGRWSGDLEGKVTLVNLWATWCTPCRAEVPDLIELENEWGSKGFEVLGVSVDNPGSAGLIQDFAAEFGINYQIVHDARMTTMDAFATSVIPTSVLVDRDGRVIWEHIGPVSSGDPELLDLLTDRLGPPPPTSETVRL